MKVLKRFMLAFVMMLPLAGVAPVSDGQGGRLEAQIRIDQTAQQRVSCTAWQQTSQSVTVHPDGSITRVTTYVRTCQRVNADGSVTVWSEVQTITEFIPAAPKPDDVAPVGEDANEEADANELIFP